MLRWVMVGWAEVCYGGVCFGMLSQGSLVFVRTRSDMTSLGMIGFAEVWILFVIQAGELWFAMPGQC